MNRLGPASLRSSRERRAGVPLMQTSRTRTSAGSQKRSAFGAHGLRSRPARRGGEGVAGISLMVEPADSNTAAPTAPKRRSLRSPGKPLASTKAVAAKKSKSRRAARIKSARKKDRSGPAPGGNLLGRNLRFEARHRGSAARLCDARVLIPVYVSNWRWLTDQSLF